LLEGLPDSTAECTLHTEYKVYLARSNRKTLILQSNGGVQKTSEEIVYCGEAIARCRATQYR